MDQHRVTDPGGDIRLSLPARTTNLRIARLTASSVAADLGFGLEDTEDLRVAVTELCSALVDDHPGGGRLDLRFVVEDGAVLVEGRRDGMEGEPPAPDPIAAELIDLTTDHHEIGSHGGSWVFVVRKGPTGPT